MRSFLGGLQHLLAELKRRKVYQVAAIYCVAAFGVLQLADIVLPALGASDRAMVALLVLLVAGFPAALLLGWMYDWTEAGVQRTPEQEAETGAPSPRVRSLAIVAAAAATLLVSLGGWKVWTLQRPAAEFAAAADGMPRMDPRRIAVLYFDDHSPDGSLGYLAAGITESLLHEFANVPGLEVSSRNAVKPFRNQPVSLDSLVAVLGVGSLVEGSVTRAGNEVRATIQLIDGATGNHVDSRVVHGTLDQIFPFQDSLAVEVARALRSRLGQEIRLRGARERARTEEAWTLFSQARELIDLGERLGRRSDQAAGLFRRADSLLAEAERVEPEWVIPSVSRIRVASRLAAYHGPRPGALDTTWARTTRERATLVLERHPGHPEAHAFRGWVELRLAGTPGAGDVTEHLDSAESDLREATRRDPELPEAWWALSEVLIQKSRFGEAVHAARQALDTDVFLEVEENALHSLFYATLQLGPREEAIRWCDEGRRRFPEAINFVRCRLLILGTFPQVEPDVEEANQLFARMVELAAPRNRDTWRMFGGSHLAQTLARAGMADSALAVLRAIRGDAPPAMLSSHEAKVYLLLGDRETALRRLEQYLTFDADTAYLAQDWWFAELHDYRPFRRLVGLPEPASP